MCFDLILQLGYGLKILHLLLPQYTGEILRLLKRRLQHRHLLRKHITLPRFLRNEMLSLSLLVGHTFFQRGYQLFHLDFGSLSVAHASLSTA